MHHLRDFCHRSPLAPDHARPSHYRNMRDFYGRKLGRLYRVRHSQYLDVAALLAVWNLNAHDKMPKAARTE
jgi:hypothetical protein